MSHIKFRSQNLITLSLLLLCGFGCTEASESEKFKKYFEEQEKVNEGILKLNIPGTRPLNIDESLSAQILETCPDKIKETISGIKQNLFWNDNEKNIILHGMPGTGKTSIAQAIAIECQIPCLFFNTGSISTVYANSGVQNLDKIFEHAKGLEKNLKQPCFVILDELEALTRKHRNENSNESNILISFWQELDRLKNSKVAFIGTMNSIEDLPAQITSRTSMIKIPLPEEKHRDAIASYYLKAKKDKHKILYPGSITGAYLAQQTKGFSHRDLQNVVARATTAAMLAPAELDKNNKTVDGKFFIAAIKEIKADPARKLEREIGTWKHTFKTHFRDPKISVALVGLAATMCYFYNNTVYQEKSMNQTQKNADRQYILTRLNSKYGEALTIPLP